MRPSRAPVFSPIWLLTLAAVAVCQNIDTDQPILREVDGLAKDALFGYSVVLHQTIANPSSREEAQNGARIVVSAPKGTVPGAAVPNTGIVYSCPVNPGTCSPLPGKLSDTTTNDRNENKTDQFLGASMASNGETLMVCAHRHTRIVAYRAILPQGKCFISSERTLRRQFQEYQPCAQRGDRGSDAGLCQAGASLVIASDRNSYAFGLGAPGMSWLRGAIIRRKRDGTTNFQRTSSSTFNSYQGYAITAGRFLTPNRQDFAVSLPRRNLYFGSVNLVMNDNSLIVASQPLNGMQMGEYFGFSLLAVDLDGDNYDELLVGAPLFQKGSTNPEIGRVYLYRNTRGNLEFVRTIEGRTRYSRFGYAMANLGDINGDGFDDVAISAPFSETGSGEPGTVYIYHSSPMILLSNEPQQVIRGTDIRLQQNLSNLRGFGTSLASGIDVDLNGYNDLLIGSFLSQKVFLLRTHPLAHVQTEFTASQKVVDLSDNNRPECVINETNYACINLTACAIYDGLQVSNNLGLRFSVSGDTQSSEKRLRFENNSTAYTKEVVAEIRRRTCAVFTAYFLNRDNIMDLFNPFIIELSISPPSQTVTPIGNGNETLKDFTRFPVVIIAPSSPLQVETLKECGHGNSTCIPDLKIEISETTIFNKDQQNFTSTIITAGLSSSVDISLNVENAADNAFQATLSFILPSNTLQLVNVFNQTRNGEVTLRCLSEPLIAVSGRQLSMIRYNCSIGNPFSTRLIQLRVRIEPQNIVGNEPNVQINFTVGSLNPENVSTILDGSNFAVVELNIAARANITIDNGVVTPEQISYSDNSVISGETPLKNVSQLGPPVDVSFLIRNSGPSRVPNIQLDILWPLNGTLTGETYYLYITSIQFTRGATAVCSNEYINPSQLQGDESDEGNQQEGGDPTVGIGTGRRKRRNTIKRTLRNKRQEASPSEQGLTEDRILSCESPGPVLNCVNIRCSLLGLSSSQSVQVDINSRLDERFFSTNNDRYTLIPTASISIVDGNYIESNDGSSQRKANAHIPIIPAARITIVGEAEPVAWWVIFLPIVSAVIIITAVAILLWVFGFFRRKKHEEIKEQREQLKNLTDHGETPGGGDGSEPDDEAQS